MNRRMTPPIRRDPRFLDVYRGESLRMHAPPEEPGAPPQTQGPPARDEAVILPLLLLLLREGADRYLLLALLYILM
ncbi:MAG: hypothetical protein IJT44_00765 [Clostridia bacterium]|nr:hypothetical protein [Clostridia bacterium]